MEARKQELLVDVKDIVGNQRIVSSEVERNQTEAKATATSLQDTSDRDSGHSTLATWKSMLKRKLVRRTSNATVYVESVLMPRYVAQTMSTKGTTVLTDDLTQDYHNAPEMDPQIRSQRQYRTFCEIYVGNVWETEGYQVIIGQSTQHFLVPRNT